MEELEQFQPPNAARRKESSKTPILSLVDREYLHSTANLPRPAWEPLSYLYSETDTEGNDLKTMKVPPELEWVRERAQANHRKLLRFLDQLLLDSQSIEALRSWQMMAGLQGQQPDQRRPSATVMPDFKGNPTQEQEKPRKRGILQRGAA